MQPQPLPHRVLQDGEQVSLSHFTHVLHRYRNVIVLSLAVIAVGYFAAAMFLYLRSRTEHVTMQRFRLDFEGAGDGRYPNRMKFSVADIVSEPILGAVFHNNGLDQYLSFVDFSRSVFVLESNAEFERLASDYQAKMSDPRISPVDRERLQQEFDLKRQSIVKNEYSIHFSRQIGTHQVPETVARKVLLDILNAWADFEVKQQHVLSYQVSVLSPDILAPSELEKEDVIAAAEVLRNKIQRALDNIDLINTLPGAPQARTAGDRVSLAEVKLRLEEIMRFRLEPLVPIAFSSGLVRDRAVTVRFLESQLDYDRRALQAAQSIADAERQAISAYEQPSGLENAATTTSGTHETKSSAAAPSAVPQPVVPQLSQDFLDRLMSMTSRAQDTVYRQKLIDDYRKAVTDTIGPQLAVAYDTEVLRQVQAAPSGTAMSRDDVLKGIGTAREETRQLLAKSNELFQVISHNMTPSAQLFTVTSPPEVLTLRAYDPIRLILYGLLGLAVALPIIILICLIHNRVREEEQVEMMLAEEAESVKIR